TTGQSIGKQQQNIKLVADATGQPVGGGMAFVRLLVAGVISFVSCGIAGLLDYLWPLWDQDKKRLTDKILNFSVVNA
ncbi:MAG: RDD family protein, partial [Actinomycetia bacterium]|nr:RDD family protein [Actinomycetes bacterium]